MALSCGRGRPRAIALLLLAAALTSPVLAQTPSASTSIEHCRLRVEVHDRDASFDLDCTVTPGDAHEIPLRWLAIAGVELDSSSLVTSIDGRAVAARWQQVDGPSGELLIPLSDVSTGERVRLHVSGVARRAVRSRDGRSFGTVPVAVPLWPSRGRTSTSAGDPFEIELDLPDELRILDAFPARLATHREGEIARARLPTAPALIRFTAASGGTSITRSRWIDLALALTLGAIAIAAWLLLGTQRGAALEEGEP